MASISIDTTSLATGFQVTRAGGDKVFGATGTVPDVTVTPGFIDSHIVPKQGGHSDLTQLREIRRDHHVTSNAFIRRALPIGAALAIGTGAGAAIYAGSTGGSSGSPTTVVASVQPPSLQPLRQVRGPP